mmetsp:Transcript_78205/g.217100  ORF Transcript_78205/g.217100 Transcript_78205/m.217100 type:complete len:201 (-) Transcript_78205:474-1076(-)
MLAPLLLARDAGGQRRISPSGPAPRASPAATTAGAVAAVILPPHHAGNLLREGLLPLPVLLVVAPVLLHPLVRRPLRGASALRHGHGHLLQLQVAVHDGPQGHRLSLGQALRHRPRGPREGAVAREVLRRDHRRQQRGGQGASARAEVVGALERRLDGRHLAGHLAAEPDGDQVALGARHARAHRLDDARLLEEAAGEIK